MKTFKYNLNGQTLCIRLDGKRETVAEILVNGERPTVADEDMPAYAAAISLALIAHEVEVVHDEEPGVITLAPRSSEWGHPSQLITSL